MYSIGISAYYHDSAITLLKDGKILLCLQEERFSRIKNDSAFPSLALQYLIDEYSLDQTNISSIVFYDKPILKFDRIVSTIISSAPASLSFALKALPPWIGGKLNLRKTLRRELEKHIKKASSIPLYFSEHHFSHACASYYTSPFQDACVVTIDGVGEWATTSIIEFKNNKYHFLKEMHFPHSVGILYSCFTFFCGFKINSGEYKLMGLAPYGDKKGANILLGKMKSELVTIFEDGSIKLNLDYFKFHKNNKSINEKKWSALFNIPLRPQESQLSQEYCDFALAAQLLTEDIYLKIFQHAKDISSSNNLCIGGGVALNCVANAKLLASHIFQNIWIHPNPGDAGAALGAALALHHDNHEFLGCSDFTPYLGASFSKKEILRAIRRFNLSYDLKKGEELYSSIANSISTGNIIGWFQGASEWGPRALGNRSILADPTSIDMQSHLNLKIKFRESFRPFAPIVAEENAGEYFELDGPAPYMQYTFTVKGSKAESVKTDVIIDKLKHIKSRVPAITHLDSSARVQTVSAKQNERIHKLIKAFESISGVPMLINTSFNVRGEPIVNSPEDAIKCFLNTGIDILVLDNFVISKPHQEKTS